MKLGDYLDKLENNNFIYKDINTLPFNYYEIKDFIKMDLTLENKETNNLLNMLDVTYNKRKKTEYLNMLKDIQSDLKEQIELANKLISWNKFWQCNFYIV